MSAFGEGPSQRERHLLHAAPVEGADEKPESQRGRRHQRARGPARAVASRTAR